MNRLEVKWDDWIDFNAYLNNQRDAQSQKIRAGLKYSLIDVKSSIDIITKVKKRVLIMTRVVKMMIWLMGKRRSLATVSLWKVSTAATAG